MKFAQQAIDVVFGVSFVIYAVLLMVSIVGERAIAVAVRLRKRWTQEWEAVATADGDQA